MSASHAVVLDGVSFRYLDEAELAAQERPEESHESCVRGVKLDIPVGTCTILCGRSGDGKSTVLRLIDGLAGRTEGRCSCGRGGRTRHFASATYRKHGRCHAGPKEPILHGDRRR